MWGTTRPAALAPAFEQKTVHILVRWLIIAIAFHFLALSGIQAGEFSLAIRIISVFAVSNLLLMFAPARMFAAGRFFQVVIALDLGFVAVALYFLREPFSYYHWLYIAALGWLFVRKDLWEMLLLLVVGLVACGAAAYVLHGAWNVSADNESFFRTSILLAVAAFYFILMGLLDRNAQLFGVVARGKQEWERTADAMSELILLVDGAGRIRRVNRACAAMLGKRPPELVGESWSSVLDGGERPLPDSPLSRMFESKAAAEGRYAHPRLSGELHATAIPLMEGNTLTGAIYVLRSNKKV